MSSRRLIDWLAEALECRPGQEATVVEIAQDIWERREQELRDAGDLFYTWQYDLRWAAHHLRSSGVLHNTRRNGKVYWKLEKRVKPRAIR